MYFSQIIILVIMKIISKSSPAWTAVFVYSCGSSLRFSPNDLGPPDPRTWRQASRAAAALFGSWKTVKLRQLWQNPEIVAKNWIFFLFSICFRFLFFFSDVFSFLFSILVGFFVFESDLAKSKSAQTSSFFFLFYFRFIFVFFPFYFRYFFQLFSGRKNMFDLFSVYFRIAKASFNLFSNEKKSNCFRT